MNYKAMLLLLVLGLTTLAAVGCPDDEDDGDTSVIVRDNDEGGSDTIIDRRDDTAVPPAPGGDTDINISVETDDDDFARNFTSEWPEVQVVVDDQVAALNDGFVTTYETTFSPDSPARERMITVFETDTQGPTTYIYRLEDFEVLNQTGTEATARVVLLRRDPASADAMDTRIERTYILRQDPTAGRWLVYDVQDLATTQVARTASGAGAAGGGMSGGADAGSTGGGAGGNAGGGTTR
jgi:hypothetical protein